MTNCPLLYSLPPQPHSISLSVKTLHQTAPMWAVKPSFSPHYPVSKVPLSSGNTDACSSTSCL